MKRVRSVLIAGLTFALAACATIGGSERILDEPRSSVDIVLENRSWELGIFRVFDQGTQLGVFRVPGLTSDTVTVQPRGTSLALRVRPLASREVWRFQPVTVRGGDVLQVTMQNHLPLSSIAIFPVGEDYWLSRYDHPDDVVFNGLERVDPPREWMDWWEDAEECTGMESSFRNITWFVSPSMYFFRGADRAEGLGAIVPLNGLHWEGNIYVRAGMADSARLIRHEALHNILRVNGVSDSVNAAHEHPAYEDCDLPVDE